MSDAVLLLADGTILHGKSFGAKGTTIGEICFNTGMTGYQEIFTDPSYTGQILITNHVHIGNYGTLPNENESKKVAVKGIISNNLEKEFSRSQSTESLYDYLLRNNVIAIEDIDTRSLVLHVRKNGAFNCLISTETNDIDKLKKQLNDFPNMAGLELASKVSTTEEYTQGNENNKYRVAVFDYGVKQSILNCFTERDVQVKVFPAKTSLAEVKKFKPHGFFLSNGPGDPEPMDYAIKTVKEILELNAPVFGICLGHQLLALANNISTFKMHHGHRGANHPVKNLITGRCEITTQNHGFGVSANEVLNNPEIEVTHINLNDDSIEGFRLKNKPAFSVQYHPEASPGPHDSRYLFDEFVGMLSADKVYE